MDQSEKEKADLCPLLFKHQGGCVNYDHCDSGDDRDDDSDVRVEVSVEEDGSVVADIVWSEDESEAEDGGWRVFVISPEDTMEDRLAHRVNTSEFRVLLNDSHPLSEISIQQYELQMTSDKSDPVPLFR